VLLLEVLLNSIEGVHTGRVVLLVDREPGSVNTGADSNMVNQLVRSGVYCWQKSRQAGSVVIWLLDIEAEEEDRITGAVPGCAAAWER
jgi:hypothetical protein